ncbi:hypothetical protein B0T19DRAFT_300919 [Cercophora scortea]|uniref:Uncharacterized protein n=1 Tax=Cercophora scortea TaxID=314031 RepID=A0AAE0M404_9PEZI|nr:hypothetical protein B0T19DRAFT_300919 [Cercophora scortea]
MRHQLASYLAATACVHGLTAVASPLAEAGPGDQPRPQVTPAPALPQSQAGRTHIWSSTKSLATFYQFINPRRVTLYTTVTITSVDPWTISSYPTTVVASVTSHVTWEGHTTYLDNGDTGTSLTSFTATVPETWVVARPAHTDIPAGTTEDKLPCAECSRPPPDPLCEASGLQTACQGQCRMERGAWWCYMLHERDYKYADMRMGRVCWGGNSQYRQLNAPCVVGDGAVACVPCQGKNISWGALNWEGPVAGEDGIGVSLRGKA